MKGSSWFDVIIQICTILGLIALIIIPLLAYHKLPETIPTHYGIDGKADGFSGKINVFLLPILGIAIFVFFKWISKYPHKFNYPFQITEENRERSYQTAVRMIKFLNAMILCSLAYITYSTIRTAAGEQSGLSKMFIPIFIILNVGITFYYVYKMSISNKEV